MSLFGSVDTAPIPGREALAGMPIVLLLELQRDVIDAIHRRLMDASDVMFPAPAPVVPAIPVQRDIPLA